VQILSALFLILVLLVSGAFDSNASVLSENQLKAVLSSNRTNLLTGMVNAVTIADHKYYCILSTSHNPFNESESKLLKKMDFKGKSALYKYINKKDPAVIEIVFSSWQGSRPQLVDGVFMSVGCVPADSVRKVYTNKINQIEDGELLSDAENNKQFKTYEADLYAAMKNDNNNLAILKELMELYKLRGDIKKSNAIQSQIMRIEFKTMH